MNKFAPFHKAENSIQFKKQSSQRNIRTYVLPIAVMLVFGILAGRLFELTVVKGAYYRHLAENNRLKEILLDGKRGTIYDRKGLVLAESIKSSDPHDKLMRVYTAGEAFGHILGYRQIASEQQLKEDACLEPLLANDRLGAKGIEKDFECFLRPQKGKELIEVDAHGKKLQTLSIYPPHDGKNLKLSIDAELQERAYEAISKNLIKLSKEVDLSEKRISVVGVKPETGEILVLLSYPSFDPNAFEKGDVKLIQSYFKNKEKPLFNRALLGAYPPGSVFKPFVAIGALEEKAVNATDTILDTGFIEAGSSGRKFRNWFFTKYGKTDGEVDMIKGLQRSNDIYFYKTGEKLGADEIKNWASKFGFGRKTGIIFDESTGVVPSDFWKREMIGDRWYLGDTYNLSIGQGYMLVTPLQIAMGTSAIVNGGNVCVPHVLKAYAPENKDFPRESKPDCVSLGISQETLDVVHEGMKRACQSGGTGWPFFTFSPQVGCKTGTAESHAESGMPHAWFTTYAPADKPEIVVTVMVEEAGEGSDIAAPIAKEILKTYFERNE